MGSEIPLMEEMTKGLMRLVLSRTMQSLRLLMRHQHTATTTYASLRSRGKTQRRTMQVLLLLLLTASMLIHPVHARRSRKRVQQSARKARMMPMQATPKTRLQKHYGSITFDDHLR